MFPGTKQDVRNMWQFKFSPSGNHTGCYELWFWNSFLWLSFILTICLKLWNFSLHYANVSLGTPSLWFLVALDTGSDLFWLPCDCTSCIKGLNTTSGKVCYFVWVLTLVLTLLFFVIVFTIFARAWICLVGNCAFCYC